MINDVDMTPDPSDIVQAEYDPNETTPAVHVCVEGHVRTQELPRVSAGIRGVPCSPDAAVRLLSADPTRAVARLIPYAGDILIGGSKQECEGGQPAPLAVGTVLEVTAADEVWAVAMTDATTVLVVQERWSNG
jgi:hypothetical protein